MCVYLKKKKIVTHFIISRAYYMTYFDTLQCIKTNAKVLYLYLFHLFKQFLKKRLGKTFRIDQILIVNLIDNFRCFRYNISKRILSSTKYDQFRII